MKVSICIPAYKHVNFLKRCLDSVLTQDFIDFEVIITDDSPDNNIKDLVDSYSDNRIFYYKNAQPLGSPRNWNEGLKKAQGEYIKILHHDDWFASNDSLAKYIALLDMYPEADIVFSASCAVNEKGEKRIHTANENFLENEKLYPETLFLGNILGAPSISIFRNNKGYFFDEKLIWLVDTDFYINVIKKSTFIYTPEVLVNIGISEHQITQLCLADNEIRFKEKFYLYDKYNLKDKSPIYWNSILRALGRKKIFGNKKLRSFLPDVYFTLSKKDVFKTYYYYLKKKAGNLLSS